MLPQVRTHMHEQIALRNACLQAALQQLLQRGELQPEQFASQHAYLVTQLTMLSDFWVAQAEVLCDGPWESRQIYYTRVTVSLLYQYLTPLGQAALQPWLVRLSPLPAAPDGT
jgi:hypothetical protein